MLIEKVYECTSWIRGKCFGLFVILHGFQKFPILSLVPTDQICSTHLNYWGNEKKGKLSRVCVFRERYSENLSDKPALTDGQNLDKWTESKPALPKEFEMWSNKITDLRQRSCSFYEVETFAFMPVLTMGRQNTSKQIV